MILWKKGGEKEVLEAPGIKSFYLNRYKLIFNLIKEKIMQELEFYDVKSKSKFKTSDYSIKERSGRSFAVAKSKTGSHECWRVVSKDQAAKLKK